MTTMTVISEPHIIKAGQGEPLLLAHGAGGGVEANFGQVIEALGGERTLLGVNYPGSGKSPLATDPLELAVLADSLVQAGRDAGFERFPILGLSLGTAVAVTAAVRHPDVVSGLLLTVGLDRADTQSKLVVDVWRALARTDRRALAAFLVLLSSPDVLGSLDDAAAVEAVEQTLANYPEGGVDQADLVATVDITDQLGQVRVPTIVFAAGHDKIVLPETSRRLAHGIPGAELVEYPDAGHIFTPAEVEQWIAAIRDFLRARQL